MTRQEFRNGWAVLTAQPWGRLYDGRLEPEKSQLQFELYFERLAFAHPHAWVETVKLFAGGSEWPSLNEIRQSLSTRNKAHVKALPEPSPIQDVETDAQRKAEATLSRLLGHPFTFPH